MKFAMPPMRGAREVFEALRQDFGFSYSVEGMDLVMELPEKVGRGVARTATVREGVEITILDCAFAGDFSMEVSSSAPFLEVNLCLAGASRTRIEGVAGDSTMSAGEGGLFFGPEATRGMMECRANRRILTAEIAFSPPVLADLLDLEPCGSSLAGLADGSCDRSGARLSKTDRQATVAMRQILECPYCDTSRRVFLEAKAMELLAIQLSQPLEETRSETRPLRLDDIERIHEARRILSGRLEDPPSLMELSRMVGLNDFKLKAGFKQVFGTTAFGYLHERRIEEARRLIEAGEMSVGEVALAVGYASPSRFAAAFKRRYGIRPSSLLPHRNGCRKPIANVRHRASS